jgi:hypothetical protein
MRSASRAASPRPRRRGQLHPASPCAPRRRTNSSTRRDTPRSRGHVKVRNQLRTQPSTDDREAIAGLVFERPGPIDYRHCFVVAVIVAAARDARDGTNCRRPPAHDRLGRLSCIGGKAAVPPALSRSMQLARCGGHLAHQWRAPPFASASGRRRVSASDDRSRRRAGVRPSAIGSRLAPASVEERERRQQALLLHESHARRARRQAPEWRVVPPRLFGT